MLPFIRTEVKFLFIPQEFNDGSLVRVIRSSNRVSFSMSQKFLKSFWNWWMTIDNNQPKIKSTNTRVASLRLFPLLYQIIPKGPFLYKRARKPNPTRDHGWAKAASFGTMLQIVGKRILNGNKPLKEICCNDNPIRKREGNCAWSLSIVRAPWLVLDIDYGERIARIDVWSR